MLPSITVRNLRLNLSQQLFHRLARPSYHHLGRRCIGDINNARKEHFSSTKTTWNTSTSSSSSSQTTNLTAASDSTQPDPHVEPRLSLTFTCTVPDCGTRSSHTFTRRSYEKGIVLVQCPGCNNRCVLYPKTSSHVAKIWAFFFASCFLFFQASNCRPPWVVQRRHGEWEAPHGGGYLTRTRGTDHARTTRCWGSG